MGFTLSELIDELNAIFDDASNNFWTGDQKKQAINYGIDALWPEIKQHKMVNDVTLAASTYIYSSAAGTDLTEQGYAICELEVASAPYRTLRKVFQRPDGTGGWKIHVAKDIVDSYVGKKLKLWYEARHLRFPLTGVYDTNQGTLSYTTEGADKTFTDTGQDFASWETTSGNAVYMIEVRNSDLSFTWGYLGAKVSSTEIKVYKDVARTTTGWNGVEPTGKTPSSYQVLKVDTGVLGIPATTPVVTYAAIALCTMFLPRRGHTELGAFVKMIPEWSNLWVKAKQENLVEPLPRLVPILI